MRLLRYSLWLLMGALLAIVGGWYLTGGRLYSVQTGSMRPVLRPGDAVLTRPTKLSAIKVGDIVSFNNRSQPWLVTTHRVVAVDRAHGHLTTKGDNVSQPDLPITNRELIGVATMRAPKLGSFLAWLRRPIGLTLAIYLPALTLVGLELLRLQRRAYVYYGR